MKNRRLELKLGYGFPAFDDRFTSTPALGLGLSNGAREVSLGWKLGLVRSGPASFEVGVETRRREPADGRRAGRARGDAAWHDAMVTAERPPGR